MSVKLDSHQVAKWFIWKNPELAAGYLDKNVKLNKLLYFCNLMYYCVANENLIAEEFVAFPKGPVIYSVYKDYRYNGLDKYPSPEEIQGIDKMQAQIINIINFVYGDKAASELIEETHAHSIWKDVEQFIPNNPPIRFENTEQELKEFYRNLYETYEDFDFSRIKKEKINGNVFYYDKNTLDFNDDVIKKLSFDQKLPEPQFVEVINGKLILS